ncbi:MAG: phage portal protein [Phycisphaeraceae bacterium]|nr:phage portal protein [Phycisphaeraceae bacterium]
MSKIGNMLVRVGRRFGGAERSVNEAIAHFNKFMPDADREGPSNPFSQVDAVNRCVMMYVNAVYQMPIMVGTNDDELITSGPITQLIDRANPEQSLTDVMADFAGWLLLSGRAHWIFSQMLNGRPTQITAVGKPQTKPIYAEGPNVATGTLIGWLYRRPGQRWDQAQMLPMDQVWTVTMPSFNADRPYDGLAIADVVRRKINQVYKADSANERSLDNDMKLGSVISPEEPVTEEQWKQFIAMVREQNEGHRDRHRTLFTSRAVNVATQAATFGDMEFTELLDRSVDAICVAFGFNAAAVGYSPGGDRQEFIEKVTESAWVNVIIPWWARVADEFRRGVISRFENDQSLTWRDTRRAMATRKLTDKERFSFGRRRAIQRAQGRAAIVSDDRLWVWFDDSFIAEATAAKLRLIQSGQILQQGYKCPPATVLRYFGFGIETFPWQERGWQTFNEMMISPDGSDTELPDENPPEDEGPSPSEEEPSPEKSVPAYIARLTDAQLDRLQQQHLLSYQGLARAYESRYSRLIHEVRSQTLARAAKLLPDDPIKMAAFDNAVRRDLIGQIVFDLLEVDGKLVSRVGSLLRAGAQLGGQQSMLEAAKAEGKEKPDPFNIQDPRVEARLRTRIIRIKEPNRTLRRRLANSLADGLAKGETKTQMLDRIRAEFNMTGSRARTISQDAIGGAVEDARQEGRRQANVPLKSWVGSRKDTSRPTHMEMERISMANPIANDAEFVLPGTGASTPYPRGPGLGAQDAANCACTTIARYANDGKDARLIAHLLERGFMTDEQIPPDLEAA